MMQKGNVGPLALVVIAALAIVGIMVYVTVRTPGDASGEDLTVSVETLNLSFQDHKGTTVAISDFDGPLVINSWASWCPFCVKELSDFVEAQEEFGDKVTIIAINRGESFTKSQEFVSDLDIASKLVFLVDQDDLLYQAIQGYVMPETVFINSDRTIQSHKRGPMQLDEIRTRIQDLR